MISLVLGLLDQRVKELVELVECTCTKLDRNTKIPESEPLVTKVRLISFRVSASHSE